MSEYLSLARKWRPQKFKDVLGQEHITVTFQNALKQNKISHSYLFTGPRGIGKTTTARILAKALNCEKEIKEEPCNSCSSCKEITEDRSLDVLEIDGASNRGIEQIRNLRQNIKFGTSKSRFKIYIIDEVHMLTNEAFNALLKTLEEPPAHVKFIFATTEPSQIPLTILSRCQRFDFKRIPVNLMSEKLKNIAKKENIKIEKDSLFIIAKSAQGSLRDAESMLEQLSIFTDGEITADKVNELLGLVDEEIFFNLISLLTERNTVEIWKLFNNLSYQGKDILKLLKDFIHFLRNLLIAKESDDSSELIDIRPNYRKKLEDTAKMFTHEQLLSLIDSLSSISYKLKRSESPLMDMEIHILGLLREITISNQPSSPKPQKDFPEKVQKTPASNDKSANLEDLRKIWPEILQEIKEKSVSLGTLLMNSKIKEFKNNIIRIELPITNGYFQTKIDQSKKFIQTKMSKKFGEGIKVEFIHLPKEQNNKGNIIDKAVKMFDAEIIK